MKYENRTKHPPPRKILLSLVPCIIKHGLYSHATTALMIGYKRDFVSSHHTNTKCHAGANHTGTSSPRFLCRSEIFIPARKFIPVLCKRGMTVRFISIKVSPILRRYKTRTPANTALSKHGATFHFAPE